MTKAITATAAMQSSSREIFRSMNRSVRLAVAIRRKADLEQTALYDSVISTRSSSMGHLGLSDFAQI